MDKQERAREIIREVTDPVEFRRQMKELFCEEHRPEPVFSEGDVMSMHEFVGRFKEKVCEGNETRFWQWPVVVTIARPNKPLHMALAMKEETRKTLIDRYVEQEEQNT